MLKALPSFETLNERLRYEPETGLLFWKERDLASFATPSAGKSWNKSNAGVQAGHVKESGYIVIRVGSSVFRAHRIAWMLHYGEPPNGYIDHINGIRSDNRIINLRDVAEGVNQKNAALRKDNKTGRAGVKWSARDKRWYSSLWHQGKQIHLGCFRCVDQAIAARDAAQSNFGFSERHGRQ